MSKVIDLKAYKLHKESVELIEHMLDICCTLKGVDWSERDDLSNEEIRHYLKQYLDMTDAEPGVYETISKLFPDETETSFADRSTEILMNNIASSFEGGIEPYHVLEDTDLNKIFETIDESYPNNPEISELIKNKIAEKIKTLKKT
tara:strand:- start:964 stop:1401 length:438 start_codon:yes stop_codon:yes gene_type:complete